MTIVDRSAYCNSCVDVLDDRYNWAVGCIDGSIFGFCEADNCDGMCDIIDECDCACHGAVGEASLLE